MASTTDKTSPECNTPNTGDGKQKKYFTGYPISHPYDVQMDPKNMLISPSPFDYNLYNERDGLLSIRRDTKSCRGCQLPFTDADHRMDYYGGYHKKCMKCDICGTALDCTNIYLSTETTKNLYCNDCKGRRLSAESLTQIVSKESKATLDAVKSEECVWYDCSSRSFNRIPNPAEQDKIIGDQKGCSTEKGSSTSKSGDIVQMGYRDLHGRASKETLYKTPFPSKENVSFDGESTKNSFSLTPKIRTTGIPLKVLGNSSYLKKPSTMCGVQRTEVKTPFSQIIAKDANKPGQPLLNSVFPSAQTPGSSSGLANITTPTPSSGASLKVKPRYSLRIPAKINIPTTIHSNPEAASTDSQSAELTVSDGQNIPQPPEDNSKQKSFKNAILNAFNKCSRRVPVKAFPPGHDTKGCDQIDTELRIGPCKENETPLASKEKIFFLDCSICFDSLLDNGVNKLNTPPSSVVATKCGHIFHERCIKEWLKAKSNKKCPICCTSCSSSNLLTIFVDAGPQRLGCPTTNTSSITDQELNEIHETLQKDFEDLKLKYDKLEAEHELCSWKSVVIQSLQSAFDLESNRRQELERENEHLFKKIQNMQLEAFVRQPTGLAPIQ